MNSTKIHACAGMAKGTISCGVLGFAKISIRQPENGVEALSGCLLAYCTWSIQILTQNRLLAFGQILQVLFQLGDFGFVFGDLGENGLLLWKQWNRQYKIFNIIFVNARILPLGHSCQHLTHQIFRIHKEIVNNRIKQHLLVFALQYRKSC